MFGVELDYEEIGNKLDNKETDDMLSFEIEPEL